MVHRLHAGSFSGFKKSKCKRQCYSFHLFDLSWQDLEARSYSYREWAWAVLRKLPRRWRWRKERTHPLQPHDVHVASYCASMSRSDIDSAFFAGSKALRRANVAHFFFSPFKFSKKALELGGLWFEMVGLSGDKFKNDASLPLWWTVCLVQRRSWFRKKSGYSSCLPPTFSTSLTQFKTTCTFRAWNSCNSIKCENGQQNYSQKLWDLCIQNLQWQKQRLTCWLWMDQWTRSLAGKC